MSLACFGPFKCPSQCNFQNGKEQVEFLEMNFFVKHTGARKVCQSCFRDAVFHESAGGEKSDYRF